MAPSIGQKVVVSLSVVFYVLVIVLNALSGAGTKISFLQNLFNNRTIAEVSAEYPVNITPAGYAFSIWGLIYLWQAAWLVYSVSTLIRTSAPVVLSYGFHISFILTCLLNSTWLIVWTNEKLAGAFIVLALNWVTLVSALTFAYLDVQQNFTELKKLHPKDLTALEILVQNGISIFTAWTTVATCLGLSIMLVYTFKLSQTVACTIGLSVLTVISVVYFALENFVFAKELRATVVPWFVIVWALTGSVVKNYTPGRAESTFTVVLLGVVSVLILVRFCYLRPKVLPQQPSPTHVDHQQLV